MYKRILLHFLFWIANSVLIALLIGVKQNMYFAIVFTSLLTPIIIATSYLINYWLFPKYLFKKQFLKFISFGLFITIISIYLETLIILCLLICLGNYSFKNMPAYSYNIEQLAIVLFFIVFLSNLIYLIRRWSVKEENLEPLIQFKSNRKTVQLLESKINYIESQGDYVKIYSEEKIFTTREKISKLEDRLSSSFIRVHRSYLINITKIESFNNTKIVIFGNEIPISRKYKPNVLEKLTSPN
ncbi:LytR/AlgR family response regulator transcription factor [Flavivirga algicola]|uniref:LytTR family transcriptional regulator n=1 Tax=Flavivirga algicola TaxID=2729136 RepID=A0ABX1RWC3_9FLAO|nr:LytTR family DNA-binding domain-containing protein [Flavivirga algicola]NMH87058.1 LytTR family transcriptional regulator [Flavivirga algicola]